MYIYTLQKLIYFYLSYIYIYIYIIYIYIYIYIYIEECIFRQQIIIQANFVKDNRTFLYQDLGGKGIVPYLLPKRCMVNVSCLSLLGL